MFYHLRNLRVLKFHRQMSTHGTLSPSKARLQKETASEENLRLRRHLAVAHRLFDKLQMNEGACNHLTVMAPSLSKANEEVMLVAPGFLNDHSTLHWSHVTASSLIGLDKDGNVVEEGSLGGEPEETAVCIHLGVRRVRPDIKVLFHVHAPYSTALGCLKDPSILPVHQNSLRFVWRTAYHSDYNVPHDADEGEAIGKSMGGKNILMMCNHGTLVAAPDIPLAFDEIYYLERACLSQVLAMSAVGGNVSKLSTLDDKMVDHANKMYSSEEFLATYSAKHFYSWWNKLVKEEPDVFS